MFLAFEADILRSGVRRLEKLANILPNNNHLLSTPAPTGLSICDIKLYIYLYLVNKYCYQPNVFYSVFQQSLKSW